ncbi:hypothetical protein C8R44DRAFT_735290 [Mycena epipterygia]|nr:hypothetical protein C8R44DRAFT_735290 [Mycena epipterygia]
MLPVKPKIFHSCELELANIVDQFSSEPDRIAILGAGGMGKTTLVKAALHHPDITAKYEHRFFVACDSANTTIELAALIGSHLGLKPGKDLTKPVVQHFRRGPPPSLLILDNLETPWKPVGSCGGIEEFLSLLTDVLHVALIITMHGAERPAKVCWTRPFLEPLKPLLDAAAQQTFIETTDYDHDSEIDQLLHLTDNMPLAVDLITHLVDYEGFSNVLA